VSTTELKFTGTRPDRLVVRIAEIRSAKKTASCSFQLESRKERFKPKVRGTLEFITVPMRGRTKIVLQGIADRNLVGTLAPTETVRGVANEYVRQQLDEIARRLEALGTKELAQGQGEVRPEANCPTDKVSTPVCARHHRNTPLVMVVRYHARMRLATNCCGSDQRRTRVRSITAGSTAITACGVSGAM
jgi:hypothetical protein